MQRERGGEDRRLVSAQRRRPIRRQHMRSWHPSRGPTSKPVLIVATTANAIGRAGRPLRPKRNPFGRGLLPRGSTARWTSRAGKALGDSRGRAAGSRQSATPTHHDELRPVRTWSWFVQAGEKASHKSRPQGCRRRRLQPRHMRHLTGPVLACRDLSLGLLPARAAARGSARRGPGRWRPAAGVWPVGACPAAVAVGCVGGAAASAEGGAGLVFVDALSGYV